jgi:formylglycine-generating enzyme required for sulfatase activity
VWEWCEDWWEDGFYQELVDRGEPVLDPVNDDDPGTGARVLRGGAWNVLARNCRSAGRGKFFPRFGRDFIGIRLAKQLP